MAKTDKNFKYESVHNNEDIIKYLDDIIEGLKKRSLVFDNSEEVITFFPSDLIDFIVKAKRKDGKTKLSIEFDWKTKEKN